jgi:hypothetical protein
MNTCTHIVAPEEIMAYMDGELSADRAESVGAHVQECADCQNLTTSLRDASQLLGTWTVASAAPSPQLDQRLSETARKLSSGKDPASRFPFLVFAGRHRILFAASGAAALFLFWFVTAPLRNNIPVDFAKFAKPAASIDKSKSVKTLGMNGALAGGVDTIDSGRTTTSGVQLSQEEETSSDPANSTRMPAQPMIARAVSLSIVVKDFGASRVSLDAILARYHGYSASLTASTAQNAARSLQASLRIPAAKLAAAVADLKSLGHVENETQNGEEVTQQHADLIARLKNSRETEQRLQAILVQRTGKISDVLAVEQEIARVRGEIEQMEAEQKALEHRVDFATIDLNLAEEYKAQIDSPSPSISTRLHNALVAGYRGALETMVGIVLFFAEYTPSLLLWLALLFPAAWFLRRRWLRAQVFGSSLNA